MRQGKGYYESICNHSNFISVYLLTDDYVSTEDNSLSVYYNAVRSGTGSKRFPSVSTVIYFVGSLNCDSASDAVSWQSYASVLVIFRQIAIYNLRPIIMPYIAGFGVYSVFAISLIIDMTVFIVVDGMMLTEFRRMDVLKSIEDKKFMESFIQRYEFLWSKQVHKKEDYFMCGIKGFR